MSKHTPGPWNYEVVKTSCGLCHKIGPFPAPKYMHKKSSSACIYDDYPPTGGSPELTANARLIAAAPEMFELVELVRGSFGGGATVTFSEEDMLRFEEVALKVTGVLS